MSFKRDEVTTIIGLMIGWTIAACIMGSIVFGMYLIHPGLGWVTGGLIAMVYANYWSKSRRASKEIEALKRMTMSRL